jgi:dTDP-glucose 4,6-dehydratase
MKKTILVTGAAGFIGSHFVEHIHRQTDWNIIVIDKLTYASNGLDRLRDSGLLDSRRVRVFTLDLAHPFSDGIRKELGDNINYIVHMAAETHVDNSVKDPVMVISNNVLSTLYTLEYARTVIGTLERFFYFSTDEVYGASDGVFYTETDRHRPSNPYSASKSACEQICMSYGNTYSLPIITVNVMNAFGERQHVEKFIPKCIKKIFNNEELLIHANKDCTSPGSRYYIHARNIADAVLFLIEKGVAGELYHIPGEKEMSNLEIAQEIAKILGKDLKYRLVNFHEDRPQHDLHYRLSGDKIKAIGWKVPVSFNESLVKMVKWTLKNPKWLEE